MSRPTPSRRRPFPAAQVQRPRARGATLANRARACAADEADSGVHVRVFIEGLDEPRRGARLRALGRAVLKELGFDLSAAAFFAALSGRAAQAATKREGGGRG